MKKHIAAAMKKQYFVEKVLAKGRQRQTNITYVV